MLSVNMPQGMLLITSVADLDGATMLARDGNIEIDAVKYDVHSQTLVVPVWLPDSTSIVTRKCMCCMWEQTSSMRLWHLQFKSVIEFSIIEEAACSSSDCPLGEITWDNINTLRIYTYCGIVILAKAIELDGWLAPSDHVDPQRLARRRFFRFTSPSK